MRCIVLLLRGINVGGKNILPMKDLRDLLSSLGASCVSTYIQSGNVVLKTNIPLPTFGKQLSSAVENDFGFRPTVTVLDGPDYESIIAANPFADTALEGKHLHTWFLKQPASEANLKALEKLASNNEQFYLSDRAFYLHAPAGIGRSKLAAAVEKMLGVTATARNENTVQKLLSILRALQ